MLKESRGKDFSNPSVWRIRRGPAVYYYSRLPIRACAYLLRISGRHIANLCEMDRGDTGEERERAIRRRDGLFEAKKGSRMGW